jgi:serine/threonine-protein kinase
MQLNHPNICHIYDVGREGDDPYIVMEWIKGVTLARLIKRSKGGLPIPEAAQIISSVASALEHAHGLKDEAGRPLEIVHRDVSPQNIMVSFDGTVKLLDFGVARVKSRPGQDDAGSFTGRLGYLSPEQAMSRPIDYRTDLFALGVCFYEAVAGKRLFGGDTEYERLNAIINGDDPDIRRVRPDTPPELARIIEKSLRRVVDERFQSGLEMRRAIDEFLVAEGEVVDTHRLAELTEKLCAEDLAKGPQIDARRSVAARFDALTRDSGEHAAREEGDDDAELAVPTAAPEQAWGDETVRDAKAAPEEPLFDEPTSKSNLPRILLVAAVLVGAVLAIYVATRSDRVEEGPRPAAHVPAADGEEPGDLSSEDAPETRANDELATGDETNSDEERDAAAPDATVLDEVVVTTDDPATGMTPVRPAMQRPRMWGMRRNRGMGMEDMSMYANDPGF